jgi:hypothetical protein
MDIDLSKAKLHFTVREVMILLTFLGGLASTYIRMEIENDQMKKEISSVQMELQECKDKLASTPLPTRKFSFF